MRTDQPLPAALAADIEAVRGISIIPQMLDTICKITGMHFSAVARVTDKHWIALQVKDQMDLGLEPGSQLELSTTICDEIRQHHQPVLIDHVAADACYANHKTPALYGFQSYISVPIFISGGAFFGTLCALDAKPVAVNNPEIKGMFELFAQLIAFHLENNERLIKIEKALEEEKENVRIVKRFIGILGHDLRSPMTSIKGFGQLIKLSPESQGNAAFADRILKSTERMSGIVDNVIDFASGHLGTGIPVQPVLNEQLEETFNHIISEMQIIYPELHLAVDMHLSSPVYCDADRLGQLFANLLENAIKYGDKYKPITIRASSDRKHFLLAVTNEGSPIHPDILEAIFKPFNRGKQVTDQNGLGLGLYIATEIAQAHQGKLSVNSQDNQTTFTLLLPENLNEQTGLSINHR